jgi:hypothetical protein
MAASVIPEGFRVVNQPAQIPQGFRVVQEPQQMSQFDERKKQFSDIGAQQGIHPLSKIYQQGSVFGGAVGDVLGNAASTAMKPIDFALNAAVPDEANLFKMMGKVAAEKTAPIAQGISEVYGNFKSQHPEAAGNIEATGRYLNLVPGAVGYKQSAKGLELGGEALEKSGKNSAQKMKSNFVQDLLTPKETPTVRSSLFAKSKEKGLLKSRVVEPTPFDLEMIDTVASLPVSKNKSLMKNYEIITKANTDEAQRLSSYLAQNDVPIKDSILLKGINDVQARMAESPFLVGDGEKAVGRVLDGALKALNKQPRTASGLLQARKDFDTWVRKEKGTDFYGSDRESAINMATKEVRRAINNALDQSIPEAGVKESLRKQFLLYEAMDAIESKGGEEAKNMLSRMAQKAAEGMPGKTVAAKAAIGGGMAAAGLGVGAISPVFLGGGLAAYTGTKALMSPMTRKITGNVVKGTGKLMQGKVK